MKRMCSSICEQLSTGEAAQMSPWLLNTQQLYMDKEFLKMG